MQRYDLPGWGRSIGLALLGALAVSCQHTALPPAPSPTTAWRSLYNGSGTEGWIMAGPGQFKQADGALITEGGMGLLWYSREQFGNCQIRVIFKPTSPSDNSGVFIRMPSPPADPWQAVHQGYEVQIENNADLYHRTGCLYSFTKARNAVPMTINDWNTMIITLDGPRTLVEVNGQLVTDYSEGDPVPAKKEWYQPDRGPRPGSGYIGLQNHDANTRVHFKEISVRPLQ